MKDMLVEKMQRQMDAAFRRAKATPVVELNAFAVWVARQCQAQKEAPSDEAKAEP
jgi:hypothetical protein